MNGSAIAVDIGTSGVRGQLLDLGTGEVVRTCVTTHNPLPGANVMDHLSFAIERGPGLASEILSDTIRELIAHLRPDRLERLSVCGNPIQLSLFTRTEIRDLAYAGANKLAGENVGNVDRSGRIISGDEVGLSADVEVIVPPAIRHEIGADALAMMLKSGFLDDDMCMVTDYGTNAEMALKVGDSIFTGSAAAGPALEGQQISSGMLAGPGAVSDLVRTPRGWQTKVLDDSLMPKDGPLINIRSDLTDRGGLRPVGITGTGVVALVYAGMQDDRIVPPDIVNDPIRIDRGISFGSKDLKEAGKAFGAIRAGQMTLMVEAGVGQNDIDTMYMAGASGTYVDPIKAKAVGMVPPGAKRLVQVGNTSLQLARDIVLDPEMLKDLNVMREKLLAKHIMFAASDVFRDLYVYELAYWTEGMSLDRYRRVLSGYGLGGYLDDMSESKVDRQVVRDIRDIGESLEIFDTSTSVYAEWDCSRCMKCVRGCPENALSYADGKFSINTGKCLGTACYRCEENCPEKVFDQKRFGFTGGCK